jgi:hypothetical protein
VSQKKDAEREKLEANLEGNKKNIFSENVVIGRIFMAIDNLKNRCHSFNMANRRIKKQASVQVKKKDARSPKAKGKDRQGEEAQKAEGADEDLLFRSSDWFKQKSRSGTRSSTTS